MTLPPRSEIQAAIARKRQELERAARRARLEEIRANCETFAGFVKEAWHVLEPNNPLKWNWHLQVLCDHLEAITWGHIRPRLIVNIPPGSSKSMIVSVLWQAWEWGPCGLTSNRFLTSSFELGNVKRDTRKTRDLILSEWFQDLWPIRFSREGELSFANDNTGTREGVAFKSITGKRGDRVIIDDPHSLDGAESDVERNKATRRFVEGGLNRLNDQMTSALVVVMQRLHETDLTGVLLARGGFIHLYIPMEFEIERPCSTELPWRDPRTEDGELMDPGRFPPAAIAELKTGNSFSWAGQYQQRPTAREGGMFKRSWFPIVEAAPVQARRVRAWDFASTQKKAGNNPDWTVGIKVSEAGGIFYVEHVIRFRDTPAEVDRILLQTARADGYGVTVRTPKDPGQAGVAQSDTHVKMLAGFDIKPEKPTGDKEMRARPAAAQAQAGNVRLVAGDWTEAFLDEICVFPASAFDDQVDAFADAINELALGSSYDASLDWVA